MRPEYGARRRAAVWGLTLFRRSRLRASRKPFAAPGDIVPGEEARVERDLRGDRLPAQDLERAFHGFAAARRVFERGLEQALAHIHLALLGQAVDADKDDL